MAITRREALLRIGATPLAFAGLPLAFGCSTSHGAVGPYGPLVADPDGVLDLPNGFSYQVISKAGEQMDDGLLVPANHDGMATFRAGDGKTVLVRNHENSPGNPAVGPFGDNNELLRKLSPDVLYDVGGDVGPCLGGTTTIIYDTRSKRVERHALSLAGTVRNCAGGPTPWNSWISCEETVLTKGDSLTKDHGYNFEVPALAVGGCVAPVPLEAMGRFNHEAIAVDTVTGIVYQTEDCEDGLFYRFVPKTRGVLRAGGTLQALVLDEVWGGDTRNWVDGGGIPLGAPLAARWVEIENPKSPKDDLRKQGYAKGAALFARGEGMWFGRGVVFFTCTNGGNERRGQIWRYRPTAPDPARPIESTTGTLELFFEPNDGTVLDHADNITIAPWGDLFVCEDGLDKGEYLRVVTPAGRCYTFAHNAKDDGEFAGAVFSPDGTTLFVNLQTLGMTLAITGPWA